VPIDETFTEAVAFVLGLREREGVLREEPIGTGFFVSVPSRVLPDGFFLYLVTAAHVIVSESTTGARFTGNDGQVHDFPIPRW